MNIPSKIATGGYGLLANGSSGNWDISVDESFDHDNQWLIEIEGPIIHLVLQLPDLKLIGKAIAFLESHLGGQDALAKRAWSADDDSMVLGMFGLSTAELVWDNEDVIRCFLKIGSGDMSTMQISFLQADVESLLDALRQTAEDLKG